MMHRLVKTPARSVCRFFSSKALKYPHTVNTFPPVPSEEDRQDPLTVKAVSFDGSGTTGDAYGIRTKEAFADAFEAKGMIVSPEIIQASMGGGKIAHILAIAKAVNRSLTEDEALKINADFEERLRITLASIKPIPEAIETFKILKDKKLFIGLNTAYPRVIADIYVRALAKHGLRFDFTITSTEVGTQVRPDPLMLQKTLERFKIIHPAELVVLGDTKYDMQAAKRAGCFAIASIGHSSELNISSEKELDALLESDLAIRQDQASRKLIKHGAHYAINQLNQLPSVIDDINKLLSNPYLGRKFEEDNDFTWARIR